MRSVRTTLKLAPRTQDDEYNRRKRAMKDLHDALSSYKGSMEKAKAHVQRAVESLTKIKIVFEKMTESPETPVATRDVVMQFGATLDRINGDYLAQYTQAMDNEVIPAVLDVKKLYDECAHQENERNKVMKEYDVYRNEVLKKESEYAKKNKDLAVSKSYGPDLVKRNDLKSRFEEADTRFKDSHDFLTQNTARCTNRCMVTFFQCTSDIANGLGEEFRVLYETARGAEQAEPTPLE